MQRGFNTYSNSNRGRSTKNVTQVHAEGFHVRQHSISSSCAGNEFCYDPDPQEYEMISLKNHPKAPIDEDQNYIGLDEDIFSMILVTKPGSPHFFFLMSCLSLQYSLLFLLLFNLLIDNPPNNVLSVPPGISMEVRLAQFLAVILAAMTADDVLASLGMFYIGVHEDVRKKIPGATKASWAFAFGGKFLEGTACLFIIFILVVQAADVITLCLNFAALSFVWTIDDVFFQLAKNDFFTTDLSELANSVGDIKIRGPSDRSNYIRNFLFFVMMSILLIIWGVLVQQQISGKFLCNSLLVQFDDEYEPVTSRFSGVFKLTKTRTAIDGYAVYEGSTDTEIFNSVPVIAHCDKEGAWTLSLKYKNETKYSPCRWKAISPSSKAFDITTVKTGWLVRKDIGGTQNNGDLPYVFMKMECIDCETNDNPSRGSCSNDSGSCVHNRCVCKEGRFGLSCEYLEPCEALDIFGGEGEGEGSGFSAHPDGKKSFTDEFRLLRSASAQIVTVKDKPVYYQSVTPTHYALIVFNGFRWSIISTVSIKDFKYSSAASFPRDLANFMQNEFHPYFTEYTSYFTSEPMLISSPSDRSTPSLLKWYSAAPSGSLLYPSQGQIDEYLPHIPFLACHGCSVDNLCRHGAKCVNGECVCLNDCSSGYYCENVDPECSLFEIWGHDG